MNRRSTVWSGLGAKTRGGFSDAYQFSATTLLGAAKKPLSRRINPVQLGFELLPWNQLIHPTKKKLFAGFTAFAGKFGIGEGELILVIQS